MRILVVEDEADLNLLLRKVLTKAGYTVDGCRDGEEAQLHLLGAEYDAILLDVMMPKKDGYTLVRELREAGNDTPVLFLTARDSVSDRVKGLDLGADDYLVKPFEIEELMARVETVLRRTGKGGRVLTAFDVELDTVSRTVTKGGKPLDLTPLEFGLLEQLMRNRGAALYRDVLYERVWGGEMTETRTLDLHIQRLRKKLGWQDRIETVYKVGYRLKKEEETP